MEAKPIDAQILQYLPLLGEEEKRSLLSVIKSFLTLKKERGLTESEFIQQYNNELDEALLRINAGEFSTQEEVEKEVARW